MKTSGFLRASLFGSLLLSAGLVQAQVTAAQAARLGQELTPIGAEKAGNAAGTIPAWDGGLARDANAYDPALAKKLLESEDAREGVRSMVEKRPGIFKGL